jgi:hypothetical protein
LSVKINELTIENVKRVKAVRIEPTASGLTVIGGNNKQGKTSVLDAIAWALGGDKFKPSNPEREGSVLPPSLNIKLSNGLIVERKGKNSDLKVIDPAGQKGGQTLLNEFVEALALDLPKFMQSTGKEKANTLLQIIGVGDKLFELERQEIDLYNRRRAIGQIADQKEKFAAEMTYYPDAPEDLISASELINRQQAVLARNGENQRKRQAKASIEADLNTVLAKIAELEKQKARLISDFEIASKAASDLQDESTAELEEDLRNIEKINIKVRANLDKQKAEGDAKIYRGQYTELSVGLDTIRQAKIDLLKGADLPLQGLSVNEGELIYNGQKWDGMSSAEQLKVATAIVRKLNPKCGFVLIDKLEQMDIDTMREFGAWLEAEGLQAIATRVSTGAECSIIIEDGYVRGEDTQPPITTNKMWKAGEF